jgi:hypothetical protein
MNGVRTHQTEGEIGKNEDTLEDREVVCESVEL